MHTSRRVVAVLAAATLGGAITVCQTAPAAATSAPATSAAAGSAANSAPAGWVATATRAVTFTGARLGAVPAGRRLHLAIALTPRHRAAMTAATHALYRPGSPTFHHYLTPARWRARYAPSPAAVRTVTSYLHSQGLSSVEVSGNRMLVTGDATAAQAQRAFHTTLANFRLGQHVVFGNTAPALVPQALSGVVSAVVGLDGLRATVTPLSKKTPKAGPPDIEGGLTPAQFRTTYDANGTRSGAKVPVAILTEGSTKPVVRSLRIAERKEHLPRVPVKVVKVGAQNPRDTSGATEFDMDSQVSTGVAGAVRKLYLYNVGSLLSSQIVADFNRFAADDKAVAMSASIGGCEYNSYLDGSELATDTAMQEAAMQGQTLFASSGDNGDACMYVAAIGAPVGVPGVNWPASGTFTTAVGGTSLVTDDKGNRITELAWAGSGGGISPVENPGWWTAASDPATPAEYLTGGRAVPDISLDADPNVATPAKVYVGKALSFVGGTSLSSPMMLGFWARIEAAHHSKLGLASIPLYRVYDRVNPGTAVSVPVVGLPLIVPSLNPKQVPGFTDIVLGTNGIYPALPGYDESTGLGAPDVKVLSKVIVKGHHKKK